MEEILKRLQRLEDIEAIRQLKHAYCYACDDNYNPEVLKSLFAENATWEADGFGKHCGPDEIAAFFKEVSKKIVAAAHLVMNECIDISDDGLTATGVWRNNQPLTIVGDDGNNQALWMLARYDEKYVKVNGKWLFQELVASIQYSAMYETGWADIWGV